MFLITRIDYDNIVIVSCDIINRISCSTVFIQWDFFFFAVYNDSNIAGSTRNAYSNCSIVT